MSVAWRDRLDARIDHCGSCGAWQFDGLCTTCEQSGETHPGRHQRGES